MPYVAAYLSAAVALIVLDFAWLSYATPRIYRPLLGDLLAPKLSIAPGVAFYLIYLGAVVFLAVAPGFKGGGYSRTAINAAVLGLAAYATYDLTNQATLRTWAMKLTLIDMTWGVFITTATALAGLWGARTAARLLGGS